MEKLLTRAGLLVAVVVEGVAVPAGESPWPRDLLACTAMIADGGVTYSERRWWRVWRDATHIVAVPATAEVVCQLVREALDWPAGGLSDRQVSLMLSEQISAKAVRTLDR